MSVKPRTKADIELAATSSALADRLFASRQASLEIAAPLSDEDQVVQAMDDASPTKWHLAHTTWFYEAFVLRNHLPGYEIFSDDFLYCFNSYYETQGARHPRPKRGLLTRPSAADVRRYRAHVDEGLQRLTEHVAGDDAVGKLIELGINHEQQHQELMLTDILSLFAAQPFRPAYKPSAPQAVGQPIGQEPAWISYDGGISQVGHDGPGFHYDNEGPRHDVLIGPHRLCQPLVTNREWLAFMTDGGYDTPTLWLADGWSCVQENGWQAPEYWEERDGQWCQMTLNGLLPVDAHAPVCHVSYYEADAFARWAGKRLPSEFEWETAASVLSVSGNTYGSGALKPRRATNAGTNEPAQMFGDVWEWTQNAYLPYPGYRPPQGAVGEYNGKFMCSQHVLRGASCVTADGHTRATYRNFFYPHQRWQFTGLRLAEDGS